MAGLVESVLLAAAEKDAQYKTIEVHKAIDLEIDEGNLLACDSNPIDIKIFRSNSDEYISNLSRDNTQLLFNRLWQLPTERVDDAIVAQLPEPTTKIPREKPIPKPRPPTKWEEFAKLKGIQNRKRGRMVYDKERKEYRPTWGYKSKDVTKEWLIPVPGNSDPYEDQFNKQKFKKGERVAKNELNRLRNIARVKNPKVPNVGLVPIEKPSKEDVTRTLLSTKTANASVGKFSKTLPNEKGVKYARKKRKFEPNFGDMKIESQKQMNILDKMFNKQPKLNVTQAVNTSMLEEQRSGANRGKPKKKMRRSKGGKKLKNMGKKAAKKRKIRK